MRICLRKGFLSIWQVTVIYLWVQTCFFFPFLTKAEWGEKEAKLKAAMLVNFGKFAVYPEFDGNFQVCVLGENYFGQALSYYEGKEMHDHTISLKKFAEFSPEVPKCHLLFISRSETGQVKPILKSLQSKPVLTVSEIDEFAEQGGAIQLVQLGARLRFKINVRAAREAGIALSSRLLKLAIVVD